MAKCIKTVTASSMCFVICGAVAVLPQEGECVSVTVGVSNVKHCGTPYEVLKEAQK